MPQHTNEEEEREIRESLDLLHTNPNNPILMELEAGDFILCPRKIFDDLIKEINDYRIKAGDMEEGVNIIAILEED